VISVATHLSIGALHEEGVPKKTIARRLGVDVRTVRKYVRRFERGETELRRAPVPRKLDPYDDLVAEKVLAGLSATQIYQDLLRLEGFDASYPTVQRHVKALRVVEPEVYCRLVHEPGEEAQIDFGEIGRLLVEGQWRKVHLFVMTLCYSRYSYHELVLDQTVPTFLGAIRRGFEDFGGVPARLKPDNLRSAVLIDRLGDRHYQEDFFRFCRHYGTVPDAARIRTPTDKGKVEREIGYAKGSCFRGRDLQHFEEARSHLARWRREIALVRVHGTTRRRPVDLFAFEKPSLRALPEDPYEICQLGRYKVRRDCHVHVLANYYSVPYRFVGQSVLVRLGEERLAAFADGERIAEHERARGRGQQITDPAHYPPTKRIATQEIRRRRLLRIRGAGPYAAEYVGRLRGARPVFGDQLLRLTDLLAVYGEEAVEKACRRALYFGATQGARKIESILERGLHEKPLPNDPVLGAAGDHDFGRPLNEYAALLESQEVA
jgi:transposase